LICYAKAARTPEHQMAFGEVKARLVADLLLACPDFSITFTLQTDASDYGIGAILTQVTEKGKSNLLLEPKVERRGEKLRTTVKECLATVWAIRKLKPYLEGYRIIVVTDHMALKWLNSIESP